MYFIIRNIRVAFKWEMDKGKEGVLSAEYRWCLRYYLNATD